MQLRPTDLPEPVVPATSRCGIGARSATTGSPAMFLPRMIGSCGDLVLEGRARDQLGEDHHLALGVGQLDADHRAAGDGGDARRERRHVAGDVVGELDDPARLDAARRLQLVHGDDRAGPDLDDLALDREIVEHRFEQPGVALERRLVEHDIGRRRRRVEQVDRGQAVAVAERERGLALAQRAAARRRGCGRR